MESIEYINSNIDKTQLVFNNYLFSATSNQYLDGSTLWRCCTKNCNVNIRILEQIVIKEQSKPHEHPPMSNCEKDVLKEVKILKERVASDMSINPKIEYDNIYEKLLKKYDQTELAEHWKTWNSIRGSIWYHQNQNGPKNPESLSDIILEGEYTETKTKKPFLR